MPPKRKLSIGSSSRTLRSRSRHPAQSVHQHEAGASNPRNGNLNRRGRGRHAISASSMGPSPKEPSPQPSLSPMTPTPSELETGLGQGLATSDETPAAHDQELTPPPLDDEMVVDTPTALNADPSPDHPSGEHQHGLEADIISSSSPVPHIDDASNDVDLDMDAEGDDDLEYIDPKIEDTGLDEELVQEPPLTQESIGKSSVLSLTASPSPPPEADAKPKSKSKSSEPLKPKGKAKSVSPEPALDESNLLSAYVCPICYCPPTNATLTPCGHISCGPCLFAAVKTALQRNAYMAAEDRGEARCPVCRANIPGWDGKGGGVIGLNVRAVLSL